MKEFEKNQQSSIKLAEEIDKLAQELDTIAQDSANHAFNLGCWSGLLPVFLITFFAYLLTNRSWVAAAIIGVLMLMALLGVANLIAKISLTNSVKRHYRDKVIPTIDQLQSNYNIDRQTLEKIILDQLPSGSILKTIIRDDDRL